MSAEVEALNNYAAATAAGRHAEATRYVLDFLEQSEGEHAPLTVSVTQSYGNLLRKEGDLREAVSVLKEARERGIKAFGEYGMELFHINLDLGEAYVDRALGPGKPKQYFDDALEVLRRNGQHETILYVKTLVGIAARLTQSGALEGALAADTAGVQLSNPGGDPNDTLVGSGLSSVTHGYQSGYSLVEPYMREAVELAADLEIEDPYLSAKVAIVESKTKVLESIFLEVIPASVRGSVTGKTIRENHQREDARLASAIDVLMGDATLNQGFLEIANSARMDIAWLSKDMERLADYCSRNTFDMSSKYPPDRLFEVEPDGSVVAPGFSFMVSSNIFTRAPLGRLESVNKNEKLDKKPMFIPVCIDGRLMAALTNVPTVTIEEIRR